MEREHEEVQMKNSQLQMKNKSLKSELEEAEQQLDDSEVGISVDQAMRLKPKTAHIVDMHRNFKVTRTDKVLGE